MDTEIRRILVKHQGELEEQLKTIGGKNAKDLTKEEVFAWMKWKAQWELIADLFSEIK